MMKLATLSPKEKIEISSKIEVTVVSRILKASWACYKLTLFLDENRPFIHTVRFSLHLSLQPSKWSKVTLGD